VDQVAEVANKIAGQCVRIGVLLGEVVVEQSNFSQKTFGADTVRGPIASLEHLREEVEEVIKSPHDLEEYADCMLLIIDASRRAGFDISDVLKACREKQEKNKLREWVKSSNDPNAYYKHK
jgi:hypothetical protein